jgi:hypothetical protein
MHLTFTNAVLCVVALTATVAHGLYDIQASIKWIAQQGCVNATITNCPGNRLCTDTEFYARALAAGGVVDLNPNDPLQAPYESYKGYNLCLGQGFTDFLVFAGFTESAPSFSLPAGSIAFTQAWFPPGMPIFALGDRLCDSHTPILADGPHCNMECSYFIPKALYLPPAS